MKLNVGTRIFNGGDMANPEHFGTITNIITGRFGTQIEITPDEEAERKPYSVPPCMFSETYLGHGGTRFVTESAYLEYREEQNANMKEWARRVQNL